MSRLTDEQLHALDLEQERAGDFALDAIVVGRDDIEITWGQILCYINFLRTELDALREQLAGERKDNEVHCAYCGMTYPDETPTWGSEVLTEHIKVCPKHPMRALEQQLAAAQPAVECVRQLEEMRAEGAYLQLTTPVRRWRIKWRGRGENEFQAIYIRDLIEFAAAFAARGKEKGDEQA